MDGEASNRIFLKTGDLIVLQSETDDGYCSVSLDDYKGCMSPSKNHGSVFKIFPLTYQKKKQETRAATSSVSTSSINITGIGGGGGGGSAFYSTGDEVTGDSVPALQKQLEGRAVVYGQVLQLQHITTSRFLAAKVGSKQNWGGRPSFPGKNVTYEDEVEGTMSPTSLLGVSSMETRNAFAGGLSGQVMLIKGSRKRCWFRLMPRFKGQGKGEGDKIYYDENVCLVHVKSGQFVVSGVSSEFGDLTPSIGLSISLAGWKLSLYSIVGDGFVKPGDALRFFHEEGGYLSRSGSVDGKGGVYLLGHGPRALYTYGTIWQVEAEDEGGVVGYSMPVRIRLLHHDLFLCLTEAQAERVMPVFDSTDTLRNNAQAQAQAQSRESMWLSLSDAPTHDTLFVLHAVRSHASSAGAVHSQIPYGHYVRIQHARSRRWVHCVDMFKQSPSHMMVGWKYREVVASKAFDHNNIFLVQPIPQEHVEASFYVRVRMPILHEFLNKLSTTASSDPTLTENAERVLLELVKFCTKSPNPDPIPEHQALLIAHEPLQLFLAILKALPPPTTPIPVLASTPRTLAKHKEKEAADPWLRVRKTIFLLFRQVCKYNYKNGRTLAAHLDVMTPWFGYPDMDVVETLQEIFRDNTLILDTHYAATALQAALDLLRSPPPYSSSMIALNAPPPSLVYLHDARVLHFLATLCSSNATAFPHNQNDIAAAIFAPPLGPPIATRIGPTSTDIEAFVPPPPNSDASDTGTWVDVAKLAAHASAGGVKGMFSAAIVPKHHMQCAQWVTAQLNLAAMVCMGQNYRSIHLVEGCHSWKEAFRALVQPNIPFDVRTAYCRVVLHAFVDRYPQHHIAGSMTVAPLSDITSFQTTAASEQPQEKADVASKKGKGGLMGVNSMGSGYDTGKDKEPPTLNAPYIPKNLQEFLSFFVQEESHLPDNAAKSPQFGADQLNFFRSVLVLLRHCVSFGFFKIPVLEASFLPRFSAILQITLPSGLSVAVQTSASSKKPPKLMKGASSDKRKLFTRQESFYMKNEGENEKPRLLLEVKMEVLRIINTYLSMHAKDQFISFVLGYLQDRKIDENTGRPVSPPVDQRVALLGSKGSPGKHIQLKSIARSRANTSPMHESPSTQEENALREQLKSRLKSSQTLFTYQRSWFDLQQTLGASMTGLLWHPSPSLVCNGMNILVRIQRNRSGVNSDIHLAIQSVMILVSEALVKSYQQILALVLRLRELLSQYHTSTFLASSSADPKGPSPLPQLTLILDTMRTMCLNNNTEGDDGVRVAPELQRVLRNVNAHEHTMRVLALVQEDAITSLASPEASESTLAFEAAISFLRIFCYHNPHNQTALFRHLDFLIGLMLRTNNHFNCADCIAEIFRDNYPLCTKVKARHAEAFVSLIVKHGRDFKFLSFFKAIPVAYGIPIKANQLLALRMLASHSSHTLPPIPWKGTAANASEVQYHSALLDVMGLCSYGMNHSAEAYCQSLVSVGQCIRVIGDTGAAFSVRAAYCRFLDEVYLNTEVPITSVVLLHQNDRFWTLLSDTISQIFEQFLQLLATNKSSYSRVRTDSLLAPHNRAVLRPRHRHSGTLTVGNVEITASSTKDKGKNKDAGAPEPERTDLELRDLVFSSVVPLLTNFCARHFSVSDSTKEQHVAIIVHLWEQLRAIEGFVTGPARIAVSSCLRAMQATGFTVPHFRRNTMDARGEEDEEGNGGDPPVQSALDLLDLSEINLAKIYFPLAHQLPQEALSSGANAQESLLDVLLGYIKLANGGGRGRESGAGRGGGWSGLDPHAEETAQLALHMLNMTSSLLAVHGTTEWEQVTQLGSLDGMLAVLALVRVHSHPILNPPLVLRGLKVLVAVLETAPEARATAAQLVFSRTHDDMNLCELIVVMLASAVDALGSIGRAHAREASGLGDAAGGDSLALVVVSESVGEDPYHKYLNVLYVTFQLVESVCRGESHALKTYLRHQGDHLRSYDVLKGTVQALRQLEQLVLGRNVNMAFGLTVLGQCCRTIRATVTGVPTNQAAVVDMRVVIHACNRLLLFAFEVKEPGEVGPAFDLMLQILDLIFSLIEGNPDPSPIIVSLDFKVLEALTSLLASDTDSDEVRAQLEKLASMALRVVKVLAEEENQKGNGPVLQTLAVMEEHCKLRIGRIEFVRDTKLERLYFPIPAFCRGTDENLLQMDLEDKLSHEGVSWNNPAAKLELFIEWVGGVSRRLALRHQERASADSSWYLLRPETWANFVTKWATVWTNTTLMISFIISVIILAVMNKHGKFPHPVDKVVIALGCIHVVASFLQVGEYFRREAPLIHFYYWKRYLPQSGLLLSGTMMSVSFRYFFRQLRNTLYARGVTATKYYTSSIFNVLTTPEAVFFLVFLIFSILGVAVSPLFFAFHLFQVVFRSRHLHIVLRAVTINATKLLLMGLFMLCVLFVFAIINWRFFGLLFQASNDSSTYCDTVLECLLTNLYFGVGQTGEIIQNMQSYQWNSVAGQLGMLFNFLFFITFGIFILNLVFAVIVDSFGELRDSRAEAQREKFRRCFICSIEREIFQRRSIDFYKHILEDHNLWHWLYFFIHLQTKMRKDFTSHEEYIYRKIEAGDHLSFFPVDRALCLETDESKENKMDLMGFPQSAPLATAVLGKRIASLETRISALIGQLEQQNLSSQSSLMRSASNPMHTKQHINSSLPSANSNDSVANLMNIDPSATADYPFATVSRPRKQSTKSSIVPRADRTPSPPRSSSSTSTTSVHRRSLSQQKKTKQRETAEHLLSAPAYRSSALSMADVSHHLPSHFDS